MRDISAEEWVYVRELRARRLACVPVHTVPTFPKPGRAVSYYCWSWGRQPDGDLLRSLIAGCPVRAAEKFLVQFRPGPYHAQPERR